MLRYLSIQNLALLESVKLEFEAGLAAVTGETGAGKSVLLGALAMLAGARADKGCIRQGAQTCVVEALLQFNAPQTIDTSLEEAGLPSTENGELIIKRTLDRDKGGKIFINNALSSLQTLHKLGLCWVDFHGPGEPQKLYDEREQLRLLDAYARLENDLASYSASFKSWMQTLKSIETLKAAGNKLSEDEVEFYQTQIDRIDRAAPSVEAIDELEKAFDRASKTEELLTLSYRLAQGLGMEAGASSKAGQLLKDAKALAGLDMQAQPLEERLKSLVIELQDLAGEYRGFADSLDSTESHSGSLHERMHAWLEIKRAYGPTVEQVRAKRDALAQKIENQTGIAEKVEALEARVNAIAQDLKREADSLDNKRQKAAKSWLRETQDLLKSLGFKKAALNIQWYPEAQFRDHGQSHMRIVFAPNAGQAPMPLSRIASSGEMARVMLALKAVLAKADETALLVFDEVDANVGGEIGAQVGKLLAGLGVSHQVLVVTHLPQVAAQAQTHWVVTKHQSDDATAVAIAPVGTKPNRIVELARMLGDRGSPSALEHAKTLLESQI